MKNAFSLKTTALIAFLLISSFAAITNLNAKALTSATSEWQLKVDGLVDHPLNLTLYDLKTLPQTTEEGTIYCVSFPDQIVITGLWKGVSLATLLAQAGVQSSAIKVAFFAADGYATDLDIPTSTSGNVIVAYEKDGLPLGETLRLVVPGKWGYKWISQLTSISLVDFDFKGRYESDGYPDETATVGSQTGPSAANVRATQTIPNSTQNTNTAIPPPSPQTTNSTGETPLQNTQDSKPEYNLQNSSFLPTAVEITAVASVTACAALLVLFMRRRHLRNVN